MKTAVNGSRQGFTLIEVVVVMAIVATLAGIMVPFIYRLWESNEIDTTRERMSDIKKAMVGDSKLIQNGVRTSFGYVGDKGQLPGSIGSSLLGYMPSGFDPSKFDKDAWGNAFIYSVAQDSSGRNISATIRSKGPDGVSGTSDDITDAAFQITQAEVTPVSKVTGNLSITFNNAPTVALPYYARIYVQYIDAAGSYTDEEEVYCNECILVLTTDNNASNTVVNYTNRAFGVCTLPENLPIGRVYLKSKLFSNDTCTNAKTNQVSARSTASVHNGMDTLYVNLQVTSDL